MREKLIDACARFPTEATCKDPCKFRDGRCVVRKKYLLPGKWDSWFKNKIQIDSELLQKHQHALAMLRGLESEESCLVAQQRMSEGLCTPSRAQTCCPEPDCALYTSSSTGGFYCRVKP